MESSVAIYFKNLCTENLFQILERVSKGRVKKKISGNKIKQAGAELCQAQFSLG